MVTEEGRLVLLRLPEEKLELQAVLVQDLPLAAYLSSWMVRGHLI